MKKILLILSLLFTLTAQAAVYKWVDENGTIHFSDQPQPGAEQIELSEPTVYSTQERYRPAYRPPSATGADSASKGYEALTITSPSDGTTVRSNNGRVMVTLDLSPNLRSGNKFRVYMDGKEVSSGLITSSLQLLNVDRGSHTLYAVVVNGSGKELIRSNTVTFHLQRIVPQKSSDDSDSNGDGDNGSDSQTDFEPNYAPDGTSNYTPGTPNYTPNFTPNYTPN